MKRGIIFIIIGVIAMGVAGAGFSAASRGVGNMEIRKGVLTVEQGAVDETFHIKTNAAVLIRKVEMFQYVKQDSQSSSSYTKKFSEKHEPDVTVKDAFGHDKTYSNPYFPENLRSENFYGKVLLGDSGLYVADKMLSKLALNSYIDFKNKHYVEALDKLPADGGKKFGFKAYDGLYAKKPEGWSPSDGWKVGDIRVKYYIVIPEKDQIYTVAGDINGNVIGEEKGENVSFIYDYDNKKSVREIEKDFKTSNRRVGIGGLIVAVIFLGFGIVSIVRAKKEQY